MKLLGWFVNYRGNVYGPFETEQSAKRIKGEKQDIYGFVTSVPEGIFNAVVTVEDKKLIDIQILKYQKSIM